MLDLYKLQYFVVVAKTGSFRQAAEQLHLSQPALSRSIQALERRYGVTLLDRSRTGVYLTAVGQQLLARAEELIYNAETLEHLVGSASRGVGGRASFGCGPAAANRLVPNLMPVLLSEYPSIRVKVLIGTIDTMVEQLMEGDIEFFIGLHDLSQLSDRIEVQPLGIVTVPDFFVRKGHPLTAMDLVPLAALRDYPRLSVTAWNEAIAHAIPEDAKEWIRATVEIDNLELLADITAHTEGVLITAYGNFDGDLVRLPIESTFLESLRSQIAFFTLRGRTLSPASSAVASILKEDATSRLFASPNTPPVRGSAT